MRSLRVAKALCLLLAFSAATTTTTNAAASATGAASSKLPYFGFWANNISATIGFTNLQFEIADVPTLKQLAAANMSNLYPLLSTFVENVPNVGLRLYPDYEQRWAQLQSELDLANMLKNGTLLGLFLGDELVWNCLPMDSLITYAATVRRDVPRGSGIIWYNEAAFFNNPKNPNMCGETFTYQFSPDLDWFSTDIYHMDGPTGNNWVANYVRSFYEANIYPHLTAEQRAVVIPGSFGSNVNRNCNCSCYDVMCQIDANDFWQWVQVDPMIAAVTPWNWVGCPPCNGSRWTPPHTCEFMCCVLCVCVLVCVCVFCVVCVHVFDAQSSCLLSPLSADLSVSL